MFKRKFFLKNEKFDSKKLLMRNLIALNWLIQLNKQFSFAMHNFVIDLVKFIW